MAIPKKITSYLKKNKINYKTLKHEIAYTAQEIAAVQHIPGDQVAKTVLVKTEKNFLLAVLPATYLVDFTKLKRLAKAKKISLAREEDMCKLFPDIEPGAMPPLGPLFGLPVFVDKTLSEKSEIVFNAGTHMELLKIRYKDFEKINKPVVGSFGKHV
ncbi:MAG: YbaK/EbsC family protein [Candidatus Omnitrophica bacterium]|nr:YbaK/EbsC family protein [Candidatus Omnitrophota bacterium]